jgi:serine/threonine-protein kinase
MPDDDDFWKPAATLTDDGSIEGKHVAPTPPRPNDPFAPSDEPLELDRREAAPPSDPPPENEQPKNERRQIPKAIATVLVVLLICAVALGFVLRREPGTTAPQAAPEKLVVPEAVEGAPSLTVQSDPPGATVFIQGEEAGRTPLLGSNEFARGAEVEVRVELPGYRSWVGSFAGGTNAKLRAKLTRK